MKSETIPEINNLKQAKTTCFISRTFYHEHQVDSKPGRHFCLPNDAPDPHYPVHSSRWIPFPESLATSIMYKLREPVVKRYAIHALFHN